MGDNVENNNLNIYKIEELENIRETLSLQLKHKVLKY